MSRDLEFLYEIGTLRHVARTWCQYGGDRFANLAEHSFRVAWIASILAKQEGVESSKIMFMALAHDIAESRTGDVNYVQRLYTKRNEELGIQDMMKETSLEKECLELWHEAEAKQTMEAKLVKDADSLDCDFELMEQAAMGSNLVETFKNNRNIVRSKLFTESAKKMFDQIYQSNPHDWHLNARNRFTAGDWSEKNHAQNT